MIRTVIFFCLLMNSAHADIVVAARTIPAQSLIGPDDLLLRDTDVPGSVTELSEIIGKESRVALYAGRPIRPNDIGFPAVVNRNQIISLMYQRGTLVIRTEGRALDRASPGDLIRVMNIGSRNTITARIGADGTAYVSY